MLNDVKYFSPQSYCKYWRGGNDLTISLLNSTCPHKHEELPLSGQIYVVTCWPQNFFPMLSPLESLRHCTVKRKITARAGRGADHNWWRAEKILHHPPVLVLRRALFSRPEFDDFRHGAVYSVQYCTVLLPGFESFLLVVSKKNLVYPIYLQKYCISMDVLDYIEPHNWELQIFYPTSGYVGLLQPYT